MSEKDEILRTWAQRLAQHLGVPEDEVPIDVVLDLAAVAAHQVIRPAAPLTTFIVGYAAGLASARRSDGDGQDDRPGPALEVPARAAQELAERFAADRSPDQPADKPADKPADGTGGGTGGGTSGGGASTDGPDRTEAAVTASGGAGADAGVTRGGSVDESPGADGRATTS